MSPVIISQLLSVPLYAAITRYPVKKRFTRTHVFVALSAVAGRYA
jgi:hypothetical protein